MCLSSSQGFELELWPDEDCILSTGDIIPVLVPGVKCVDPLVTHLRDRFDLDHHVKFDTLITTL